MTPELQTAAVELNGIEIGYLAAALEMTADSDGATARGLWRKLRDAARQLGAARCYGDEP